MWLLALLLGADSSTVLKVPLAPAESVAVTVAGAGTPVLLVPGLFGSAYAFRDLAPRLVAAGYRTVIVEPLGIGGSARPPNADYSLTAQAARLAAVLDTLALRGTLVVAHSAAGAMAFRLAAGRPDLVAGIVSIEGGPIEDPVTQGFRLAMKLAPLLKLLGPGNLIRGEVRRQLRSASGDTSWVTEPVIDGYTAGATRDMDATLDAFRAMARAREPRLLASLLVRVSCPVRLLVGGARHRSAPRPEEIALLRDSLPAFAVDTIPGVGHYLFEERPEAVVDAVVALGARHPGATP
jgi:pimeloyl-ACP methyl ester carboxylesterase